MPKTAVTFWAAGHSYWEFKPVPCATSILSSVLANLLKLLGPPSLAIIIFLLLIMLFHLDYNMPSGPKDRTIISDRLPESKSVFSTSVFLSDKQWENLLRVFLHLYLQCQLLDSLFPPSTFYKSDGELFPPPCSSPTCQAEHGSSMMNLQHGGSLSSSHVTFAELCLIAPRGSILKKLKEPTC